MPRGSYRSFARMNTHMTGRCSPTGRNTASQIGIQLVLKCWRVLVWYSYDSGCTRTSLYCEYCLTPCPEPPSKKPGYPPGFEWRETVRNRHTAIPPPSRNSRSTNGAYRYAQNCVKVWEFRSFTRSPDFVYYPTFPLILPHSPIHEHTFPNIHVQYTPPRTSSDRLPFPTRFL